MTTNFPVALPVLVSLMKNSQYTPHTGALNLLQLATSRSQTDESQSSQANLVQQDHVRNAHTPEVFSFATRRFLQEQNARAETPCFAMP
jgi:hypothetical protein